MLDGRARKNRIEKAIMKEVLRRLMIHLEYLEQHELFYSGSTYSSLSIT